MYRRLLTLIIVFLLGVFTPSFSQTKAAEQAANEMKALKDWTAGIVVSEKSVQQFGGVQKCFTAEPIPDGIWERMQGKSYQKNPTIGRSDLRHIRVLHWDNQGRIHIGEMICNEQIATKLVSIFRKLYESHYPIERMVLPDVYDADDERQMRANNSSCFCYRNVAGSKNLSKHAQGLAVDINPLYNPYHKTQANGQNIVRPSTAQKYCDRNRAFPYKIVKGDLCYKLFVAAGFKWGGSWRTCKDYQHFEY